jgi:hypothetical protein
MTDLIPEEYLFNDKESYLKATALWKENYKNLSHDLRKGKVLSKTGQRASSVFKRLNDLENTSWYYWTPQKYKEYNDYVKEQKETVSFEPQYKGCTCASEATELLEIRALMKKEAGLQTQRVVELVLA